MVDVSIIIVNYNTKKITSDCINSVIDKTKDISYEIIVIDNASTDGSKSFFENDERISYIYSEENLGFGRANNKGVAISSGRNILYLNSDTILRNNAVKILSDYLDANPHVGVCGGNLFRENGSEAQSYMMYFPSAYTIYNRLLMNKLDFIRYGRNAEFNHSDKPLEVAYITGADLMVKSSVLKENGGFDERFFMYYEECELCYRIKKAGYKIMSIPKGEIFHLEGASSDDLNQLPIIKVKPKTVPDSELLFFKITSTKKGYKNRLIAQKIYYFILIILSLIIKRDKISFYISLYREYNVKLNNIKSMNEVWNI